MLGRTTGRVSEIRMGANGQVDVSIACPVSAIPRAGQYLLASALDDGEAILSTQLFCVQTFPQGFWAASLAQVPWNPGTSLELAGPLGHGFELPGNLQRLGLVALGETVSRLLPLIQQTSLAHAAMTLFTDLDIPPLPTAVEVHPLATLPEALDWPDFLALDVPLRHVDELRHIFNLPDAAILPCPAQVLVTTSFPCAGLGQCGACAVRSRKGWKLSCEDGPVFELSSLSW